MRHYGRRTHKYNILGLAQQCERSVHVFRVFFLSTHARPPLELADCCCAAHQIVFIFRCAAAEEVFESEFRCGRRRSRAYVYLNIRLLPLITAPPRFNCNAGGQHRLHTHEHTYAPLHERRHCVNVRSNSIKSTGTYMCDVGAGERERPMSHVDD